MTTPPAPLATPGTGAWLDDLEVASTEYVTDTARACEVIRSLPGFVKVAMDTETQVEPGKLSPFTAKLSTISIAGRTADGQEHVWVLWAAGMHYPDLLTAVVDADLVAYGWNASFDDPVMSCNLRQSHGEPGWAYRPIMAWKDLMLGESVLRLGREGHKWHAGLATQARLRLGIDIEGKGTVQLSYRTDKALDDEQVRYAGIDALATLRLSDAIEADLEAADLTPTFDLAWRSRPAWQQMEAVGYPFDKAGWHDFLSEVTTSKMKQIEADLAAFTPADAIPTLFGSDALSWKPGSEKDVPRILNKYAEDSVREYTARWLDRDGGSLLPDGDDLDSLSEGGAELTDAERERAALIARGRLLTEGESVDKNALALMGGDLPKLIAEYRKYDKLNSTYGAKWTRLVGDDGRFHSDYTQCITATNRASSRNPNAQNATPLAKPYIKSPNPFLCFVKADYSQAELRVMAQIFNEQTMRDAFERGEDQHVVTAKAMFKVDMDALKAAAEAGDDKAAKQFKNFRSKAKAPAFGLPYGLSATGLAIQSSVNGNPTTPEEAAEIQEAFLGAKPGIKAGLEARDKFISDLAERVETDPELEFDFKATWELYSWHNRMEAARREVQATKRKVSEADIVEHLATAANIEAWAAANDRPEGETPEQTAQAFKDRIAWAQSFLTPVVLLADGSVFSWEARTTAGDRRMFEISADMWMTSMAYKALRSTRPRPRAIIREFQKEKHITLLVTDPDTGTERLIGAGKLKKMLERKELRNDLVSFVLSKMPYGAEQLGRMAVADQVKSKRNQYRNLPVQGLVATFGLACMADWWDNYRDAFPSARLMLQIHDALYLEVDVRESVAAMLKLKERMETAMTTYCPDVVCIADAELGWSLSDADDIDPADMPARAAELLATPAAKRAAADQAAADLAAAIAAGEGIGEAQAAADAAEAEARQWETWLAEANLRLYGSEQAPEVAQLAEAA